MAEDRFDICIVGAGAIGLAVGYTLVKHPRLQKTTVVVLEQEAGFGQHTSSRNSEVIHAGLYYPPNSLKALCCVRGKQLLYEYCQHNQIPHRKLGKLIVAQAGEEAMLDEIMSLAKSNGVNDLQPLTQKELAIREPMISAQSGLFSPSSGIIDSHQYMQSLLHSSQIAGMQFAPLTRVVSIEPLADGFHVSTRIGGDDSTSSESYHFRSQIVINCGGLSAQSIAALIQGVAKADIPPLYLCKGDYFVYNGKSPLSHLVYPLPEPNTAGLGIHATLDLNGQLRFGPDTEYVEQTDYQVDVCKKAEFTARIKRYLPSLREEQLSPAYSGIRPKLVPPGSAPGDFVLQSGYRNSSDFTGLIQLFGIESPGLTASLALAELVREQVLEMI